MREPCVSSSARELVQERRVGIERLNRHAELLRKDERLPAGAAACIDDDAHIARRQQLQRTCRVSASLPGPSFPMPPNSRSMGSVMRSAVERMSQHDGLGAIRAGRNDVHRHADQLLQPLEIARALSPAARA